MGNILNPSNLGVGEVYTITQGGNTTTGIGNSWATNYRGALVLEDVPGGDGDYDDAILYCHTVNYVDGTGDYKTFTNYNYENNGHFFGQPVTNENDQEGNTTGHVMVADGVDGNDADNAGGIGEGSEWERMTTLYYQYNVPSTVMQYEYNTYKAWLDGDPASYSGKIYFVAGGYRSQFHINQYDATGLLQGAESGGTGSGFLNTVTGDTSGSTVGTDWWIKITSLEENSPTAPYTNEKKWVLLKIIASYSGPGGMVNGIWTDDPHRSDYLKFAIQVVAGNFDIPCDMSTPGGSIGDSTYPVLGVSDDTNCDAFEDGEKLQLEWFKPETTSNLSDSSSLGNSLDFLWTGEGGQATGFIFSTQKIIDGSWTHINKRFHYDDWIADSPSKRITGGGSNSKFSIMNRNIYPNIPYKVWGDNGGSGSPTMKIVNNPQWMLP